MKISAKRLEEILKDVFYTDDEVQSWAEPGVPPGDAILVQGCVNKFGFHPGRLATYHDEIEEMLQDLPRLFRMSYGQGWSLMNMVVDREENLWGGQREADWLAVLAIGLGLGGWVLEPEYWSALPGSMPYFVYFDQPKAKVTT